MAKSYFIFLSVLATTTTAFQSSLLVSPASSTSRSDVSNVIVSMAYVPDGFTPESYKKFKEAEQKKAQKKV